MKRRFAIIFAALAAAALFGGFVYALLVTAHVSGPFGIYAVLIEAPNSGPLNRGYVTLSLPGAVVSYGVFRWSGAGRADQEAVVVPLSGVSSTTSTLIFDDTSPVTAVATVNPSPVPTVVPAQASTGPREVIV